MTTMWMDVPVSVPLIAGLMLEPLVSDALLTVQDDEYAPLEPQVRAPEQMVVPVPVEPNVGLTVVVFDPASERHFTEVIVSVTPMSFRQDWLTIASSPEVRANAAPEPPQTTSQERVR